MWNSRNRMLVDTDGDDVAFLSASGDSRHGFYGNQQKKDLYEKGHVAVCSKGQAIALTVFIFSAIFFTALAVAFIRPFSPGPGGDNFLESCYDDDTGSESDVASNPVVPEPDYYYDDDTAPWFYSGTPIATNGEEFPWDDIRLPNFILPVRYDIELTPNLTTLMVKGIEKLIFTVSQETQFIVFHSRNITITSRTINERLKVERLLEFPERDQIYLETDEAMVPGINYAVRIKFEYKLSEQLAGFYLSKYLDKDGVERRLATSHFEPTYARRAFPCFDEPDLKAKFLMTITHDRELSAFFNTPVKDVSDVRGKPNLIRDEFEESVEMSTYLVAFVVCDFDSINTTTKYGVQVTVVAVKDKLNQARYALGAATELMDYYADFFDVPYPLPKQDLIAIPDFGAGAMENWGLITYRETSLLYSDEETGVEAKQWIAVVVAHELAHQWFGNLVTMKWWNDLWLNEGFASWMEYHGVEHIEPEWRMSDHFLAKVMAPALDLDSLTTSHPVSVEVKDPREIEAIFDAISYKKGASIIHMLEATVGAEVLRKGLSVYLKKHKFGNAVTDDLWTAISDVWEETKNIRPQHHRGGGHHEGHHRAHGSDSNGSTHPNNGHNDTMYSFTDNKLEMEYDFTVKELMDTWTLQTGYPLVTFTQQNDSNIYTIHQQRFFSAMFVNHSYIAKKINREDEDDVPEDYRWILPLNYKSNLEEYKDTLILNQTHPIEVEFPADMMWFKANVNATGFYRVNYPKENWDRLINILNTDHMVLSSTDRAQLLDDAFALAYAGVLEASVPLDMCLYLRSETEYAPWSIAISNLLQWKQLLQDTDLVLDLDTFLLHLITPLYEKLGWGLNGTHRQRLLRNLMLSTAIKAELEEAEKMAVGLFQGLRVNGTHVPSDFKQFVYNAGIRLGTNDDWQFGWKQGNETRVPSERSLWLEALASSPHPSVLQQYLRVAVHTEKIRAQDVKNVFASVSENPAGSQVAWRFLRMEWNTIVDMFGEGSFIIGSIIQSTVTHFSSEFDFKTVRRFFRGKRKDVGSGMRNLDQAMERILINIQWRKTQETIIMEWIKARVPGWADTAVASRKPLIVF